MTKKMRKTAGALQLQASRQSTRYDPLEVGHALSDDVMEQLRICAHKHYDFFDIPEFCVVMLLAEDPLIKGLMRRKFYAWGFLPQPRPNQSVFLFKKACKGQPYDQMIRLWTLPNAFAMANLSEIRVVNKLYQSMKYWSDLFYDGIYLNNASIFWDGIRKQHNTTMLSETEYLDRKRSELIQTATDEKCALKTDSFDFFHGMPKKIIHMQ